nr:hypothetical protein Itr_chr07CG11590 [Ipomoea trifida]
MIYAAVDATVFFSPETVPFFAEVVSGCLRTRFNVYEETLPFLGKSKVVVVVDMEAKRVKGKSGDEERGVMISVNEVEGKMETGSDEKTSVVEVFGDSYDYDCVEIIYYMMNSLCKTSDFLRQGCVISDEFHEFKEVKGGLKME